MSAWRWVVSAASRFASQRQRVLVVWLGALLLLYNRGVAVRQCGAAAANRAQMRRRCCCCCVLPTQSA